MARTIPEQLRARLYDMLTPAAGLLVAYGIFTEHEAGLWSALVGAAILFGEAVMAAVFTNRNTRAAPPPAPVGVDLAAAGGGDRVAEAVRQLAAQRPPDG